MGKNKRLPKLDDLLKNRIESFWEITLSVASALTGAFALVVVVSVIFAVRFRIVDTSLVAIGAVYFIVGLSFVFSFFYAYRSEKRMEGLERRLMALNDASHAITSKLDELSSQTTEGADTLSDLGQHIGELRRVTPTLNSLVTRVSDLDGRVKANSKNLNTISGAGQTVARTIKDLRVDVKQLKRIRRE